MKRGLFAELRRRNVFRAGAFFIAATWALAQGIAQLGPAIGLPDWTTRWFLVAAVVGFPFWIAFAWFYEFTPEGWRRESEVEPHASITRVTGRKLDFAIIGVLAVAVVLLVTDRFVLHHGVNEQAAAPVAGRSIAVLPFVNMSSDKEQEYFSDGISEELLNLLAKIPQLQVTARTSSFAFKGKETGIPEIARTLHVAYVLEGSVRKSGNAVRITAQLIRAGTDTHLWSQTYDRKLDDIFAIQDEIASDVVTHLEVTLLGAAPKARTTDPAAYGLYLQARELARQNTAEAFARSDALYQQALTIDPRYAPAWNGVAENAYREANIGVLSTQEGYARAREAARRALSVDPDYAPAYGLLGYIDDSDVYLVGATKHIERALSLDPTDLDVLQHAAGLLIDLGRLDEAIALEEAIVRRDPVSVKAFNNLGYAQMYAGRYEAAVASFRTVVSLSPGRGGAHYNLGMALLLKGDVPGALVEIEQETSEAWKMIGLPMAYCTQGRQADTEHAQEALIAKYEKDWSVQIAAGYAYCGSADKAFEWLAKAEEYQDPGLGQIVPDILFSKIRSDPRWVTFLRKIGRAPEQQAKVEFRVPRQVLEGNPAGGGIFQRSEGG